MTSTAYHIAVKNIQTAANLIKDSLDQNELPALHTEFIHVALLMAAANAALAQVDALVELTEAVRELNPSTRSFRNSY